MIRGMAENVPWSGNLKYPRRNISFLEALASEKKKE